MYLSIGVSSIGGFKGVIWVHTDILGCIGPHEDI